MMRKEPAKITQMRDHKFAETFRKEGKFVTKSITATMPMDLVKSMMSKSRISPADSRVLVMFSVEMAASLKYYGVKNVVIATDVYDDFMRRFVEKYFGYKYITLDEIKEKNMKFDVVLGNPPYSGKGNPLYLQFLNTAMDISSSKVVFLTPAIYLLDQKKENTFYRDMRDRLKGRLESVVIHPHDVFGTQNAAINTAVATVTVDMENQHDEFQVSYVTSGKSFMLDDIELINQFANYDVFPALRKKILSFAEKLNAHQFESMDGDAFLNVPQLQRYKFFSEAIISKRSDDDNFGLYFDDQVTAKAAAEYFQTPFAKLALHIYKPNMHIKCGRNLRSVPMFNSAEDYSNYVELLGLTDAEIEFCNHINDNWKDYFFFS